jgi:predicted methyltransferase
MPSSVLRLFIGCSLLALAGCGSATDDTNNNTDAASVESPTQEDVAADTTEAPVELARATLEDIVGGSWRGDNAQRDQFRNPAQTLEFMNIPADGTVIEIWPGGGWYTEILAPWLDENGGQYVAAHFPADTGTEGRQRSRARFEDKVSNTEIYGDVMITNFSETSGDLVEPGSADAVLTFRNVHNWMMYSWSEKAFADFYAALRPGGTLGVVDHRLPSTREQDPTAPSGYVQQDYVIALAREAGFELVDTSEINANPADTADHPFGVWTLPPVRRNAPRGQEAEPDFDRPHYDAIGESDRMTLLFRKPE